MDFRQTQSKAWNTNYYIKKSYNDLFIKMNINRRIMIVDDEPYNLLALSILLQ